MPFWKARKYLASFRVIKNAADARAVAQHANLDESSPLLFFDYYHQVWLSCLAINYRLRSHPRSVAVFHGGAH